MKGYTTVWTRSALFLAIAAATFSVTAEEQKEAAVQLSNVVVSAAGFEQKPIDAPASITVISAEDLQNKRIVSLADALKDVEGVDISPSAGKTGGLNIRIRGMGSTYTLVLIDGRRQNSTGDITPNGFGESNNNFIPPVSAIERIEIIRGPASTLYGSDAMGGVINIITKKVSDEWAGSVKVEATHQTDSSEFGNQHAGEVFLAGPLVKGLAGVQLRARKWEREQSHVVTPADAELNMGNNPTKGDIDAYGMRLTLTPHADHDLYIDFDKADQWYDNSKNQLGTIGAAGGYADSQEYERTKYVLAHSWRNSFGYLESSLIQNKSETHGRLIPARAQNMSNDLNDREIHSEDIIFDTKYNLNIIEGHNITIGGQYWEASVSDKIRAVEKVDFTQTGLFVEDTIALLDNLSLTLGLRYDDHNTYGDFITPRAYLVWNIDQNFTLKGGYSEGYKSPRLEQLTMGIYNVGGQGRTPILGNPDLKAETSKNTEVGFYFDNLIDFSANITYFRSDVEDKITTAGAPYSLYYSNTSPGSVPVEFNCSPEGGTGATPAQKEAARAACDAKFAEWGVDWSTQNITLNNGAERDALKLRRPYNADEAEIQGVEFAFNWQFIENWALNFNYTWTDAHLISAAGKKTRDPDSIKNMANIGLKWDVSDSLDFWMRGEYRGKEIREAGDAYDALGDYKAYTQFHMGGNWQAMDNLVVGAGLYNILNQDFSKFELVDDGYVNRYKNTQEGRRLIVSATLSF